MPSDLRQKLDAITGKNLAEGPYERRALQIKYWVKRKQHGVE